MRLACAEITLVAHPGMPLKLRDARGARLRCVAGSAWVSVTGWLEDWILREGEELRIAGDGLALIEAHRHATLTLRGPGSA
jgi:hypothetical protein